MVAAVSAENPLGVSRRPGPWSFRVRHQEVNSRGAGPLTARVAATNPETALAIGSVVPRSFHADGSALTVLVLLALLTTPAFAQESISTSDGRAGATGRIDPESVRRPSLDVFSIDAAVRIDGLLTEAVWLLADSAYNFTQTLPQEGFPASERTVVRVLYDASTLYIGAMMYDSDIRARTIPGLEQDYQTQNSDMLGITIDTYLDRANALLFGINPAGALFDAQSFNDSRYINRAWEGVVRVKTAVLEDGWSAELAIPLTTMRFRPSDDAQSWGLNFLRRIRRKNEDSYWAPLLRHYRVHKMSRAGTLTGLRNLRQGRNLNIKPFIKTGRMTSDATSRGSDNDFDVGFDAKYGLTSRLTLDLTVLTDFSQVEVDQEQVNLTRFSLFFPEQRDFFLENDGVFGLGDVSIRNYRTGSSPRDFRLFHSRRIGLSADRRPVPIGAGARLTGRAGSFEIGLLNMQTQRDGDLPGENFTVARLRRNLSGGSDAGFMFVNRQGTSVGATDSYNRSFGADANFQLLRSMVVSTYYGRTDEPGVSGDRNAGYLQIAWRDRVFDASTFVKHVGESFNPGVGFIRRTAMRQAFATVGIHPQPKVSFLQEVNPYIDVSFISDLDWNLETRELTGGFGTTFSDGGTLALEYTDTFDRLDTETLIVGELVSPGEYQFAEASATYVASGARVISGTASVSHGDVATTSPRISSVRKFVPHFLRFCSPVPLCNTIGR